MTAPYCVCSATQAFIVFKLERQRNRLVKKFHRTPWQRIALYMPFSVGLDVQELPVLTAADSLPVSLTSAPEPSDVFWEVSLHPTFSPSHPHPYKHSHL